MPSGAPLRIEFDDSIVLGEAIYCRDDRDGHFIGVELDQVLVGLTELAGIWRLLLRNSAWGPAGPDKMQAMKGNPKVIAALNEALKEELTAINQYFLHAEMCENWHYTRLGDYIKKQSIDEMKHAEALIERILFLDATPNMTETMSSLSART